VQKSVAGLFVGQYPGANPLLFPAVAGLRFLRFEVDRLDVLPMLAATRVLVRAEPAERFLANPILGRVGHELVVPSL
jgi:hypothetical protein